MLDYLIKNAKIVDGTGAPAYTGAIGVSGDQIAAVIPEGGALPEAKAVIDAEGKMLTPGFIDIHSHADVSLPFCPQADNNIMQGITTFVGGNCGMGIAPAHNPEFVDAYMMKKLKLEGDLTVTWKTYKEWLDHLDTLKLGPNYVPLVGHNALRGSVLGNDYNRISTPEECEKIGELLSEALDAGAFGMSYLMDPGQAGHYADPNEMQTLFKILEARNSYVTAHTRHHQNQWVSDDGRNYYGVFVDEPGEIICGRYHGFVEFLEHLKKTPKLTAVYSHLTNAFLVPHPHSQELENALIDETLRTFVDEPVAEGLDLYYNVIPDPYSLSSIQRVAKDLICSLVYDAELKAYATEEALVANLPDPAFRQKLKKYINSGKFKMGMLSPATDPYWSDCYAFFTAKDESLLGRTLMDITRERKPGLTRHDLVYSACMEVLFDLLLEDPDLEWALTIDKREYQGVKRLIQHSRCMPMTDSPAFPEKSNKWLSPMGYGNPPLSYSVFVRYLVNLCRSEGLLGMEEAIRRITSMPADIMRLADRGRIAEGAKADLVLFDWENLSFVVDFNNPSTPPTGIDYVFVNGVPALEKGALTHALTGKVIRRNS